MRLFQLARFTTVVLVAVPLLSACGAQPSTQSEPTSAPIATAAPASLATVATSLKGELAADKINVVDVTAEEGALPSLTIKYTVDASSAADVSTAIERAILSTSKRVAQHISQGTPIDRVNMVLMLNDTQVGSTRINTRDMIAWSEGQITDQEFQSRWSQTVNQ